MSDGTDTLDSMLRAVAAAPSVRPPPRAGDKLGGRYVIEAVIGQGGMGTVFRALDEKLGETVALKVMTGALDEQVLRDEVRLAQKVTHPNVCRTFDLEDVDGYHLVKMELVPGETLAARLAREPKLPVDEAVRIARAIARGLAAAHDRKIVHADLKPANVMLDGERVVLMDFGVARLAADPVDGVRGTVGYMAPELVRDGNADERGDVYALGCVLYEMLAGESVFSGASAVVIATRHASEPAPDVRARRSETPRWLANAVTRMLAKRPDERTAGLALLVGGPQRRTRWVMSGALLATGISLGIWQLTRPTPWVPAVTDYARFQENVDGPTFSPDGRWLAFSSDRRGRNDYHAYVMSLAGDQIFAIARDHNASDAQFSRDGTALLFDDWLGTRHAYRQPIDGPPWHDSAPLEDLGPAIFADDCGDALLLSDGGFSTARLWLRFPDRTTRPIWAARPGERLSSAQCDPTGQRVVVVAGAGHSGPNDVYLVDRNRNLRQLTSDHVSESAIFAADGRTLVVSRRAREGRGKETMFEMDLDGNILRQLLDDDGPDFVTATSRDGRYLAFSRNDDANTPVLVTASGTTYLTRSRDKYDFPREVSRSLVVADRFSANGFELVTFDTDTEVSSVLTRGRNPMPSLDGKTIYFTRDDDPTAVYAIASTGGSAQHFATLPGHVEYGNAVAEGLHVTVIGPNGAIEAYRVSDTGASEREGVHGLVSEAPRSGWRAVTVYNQQGNTGVNLHLVAPGSSLDSSDWHVSVRSIHNRWLDDHRISYCLSDHCEILDVLTKDVISLPLAQSGDQKVTDVPGATVTLDGKQVLTAVYDSRVTRHVITNFDRR